MTDVEVVHLPLSTTLLDYIEIKMSEESKRSPTPILRESYIAGILANWYLNMKGQEAIAQFQRQAVAQLKKEAEAMLDATAKATQK